MERREVRPIQNLAEQLLRCLCAVFESGEHDVEWESFQTRPPLFIPIRLNPVRNECNETFAARIFNHLRDEFWFSFFSLAHRCFSSRFGSAPGPKTEKPPRTSGGFIQRLL